MSSEIIRAARVLALGAFVLAGCVHIRLDADSLLEADRGPASARLAEGYVVENLTIEKPNRLIGITRAHRAGNRRLILFCGGSSFHRRMEGGPVLDALARDADVVLFDYPGFDDSTGSPDPRSLLIAAGAVHDYLLQLPSTRHQRVVIYGFSLGGMVAAQLSRRHAADALVLEATAADVGSWVRSQVPWLARPFVRIQLDPALAGIDNVNALGDFRGPVLVLAGARDEQAPPVLSRELTRRLQARGVRATLHEIPGAGHGEIHKAAGFKPLLAQFLARL